MGIRENQSGSRQAVDIQSDKKMSRKISDSGGCKLLDKASAKRLIDSLDTVLTDCDGINCFYSLYCVTDSRVSIG